MTLTVIFFATDIPIYVAQNMLQSQKKKNSPSKMEKEKYCQ
jgi:hypothetical protein